MGLTYVDLGKILQEEFNMSKCEVIFYTLVRYVVSFLVLGACLNTYASSSRDYLLNSKFLAFLFILIFFINIVIIEVTDLLFDWIIDYASYSLFELPVILGIITVQLFVISTLIPVLLFLQVTNSKDIEASTYIEETEYELKVINNNYYQLNDSNEYTLVNKPYKIVIDDTIKPYMIQKKVRPEYTDIDPILVPNVNSEILNTSKYTTEYIIHISGGE